MSGLIHADYNPGGTPATPQPLAAAVQAASAVIAEAKPNPLAHLSTPFQIVDYSLKGYHVVASVSPEQVVRAAEELDREGFALDTITGLDWLAENQMEVIYDYFHISKSLRAVVRSRVPRENPELPTIPTIFPRANW